LHDSERNRVFPCEIWYPSAAWHLQQDLAPETQDVYTIPPGMMYPGGATRRQMAVRDADVLSGVHPLVIFSHPSGFHRRSATFLSTHLSSHGYVGAALDHSEVVAKELAARANATAEEKAAGMDAWIASRVPDVRVLNDHMFDSVNPDWPRHFNDRVVWDPDHIGLVGHSFGGWTALATPETEFYVGAIVALAPAGSSRPRPGIIPAKLTFEWRFPPATLYLVAENDTSLPLDGMHELFSRTPAPKRMFILRRADHGHFMDDAQELHERFRTLPVSGDL